MFKSKKIYLIPNPYWLNVKSKYRNISKRKNTFLYVSGNIDRLYKKKVFKYRDEFFLAKSIEYIYKYHVKNISKIKLIIQPHPSENKDKYKSFSKHRNLNIKFSKTTLLNSIKKSSFVIGHESMALVVGDICGLVSINLLINKKMLIPKKFISKKIFIY